MLEDIQEASSELANLAAVAVKEEWANYLDSIRADRKYYLEKLVHRFMKDIKKLSRTTDGNEIPGHFEEFYDTVKHITKNFTAFIGWTEEDHQELTRLIERVVTTVLHKNIKSFVTEKYHANDSNLYKKIRCINWVMCNSLDKTIYDTNTEIISLLGKITKDFNAIDTKTTPAEKVKCLVSACYSVEDVLLLSGEDPNSSHEFWRALLVCVIRANPPLLCSNLIFIKKYALESPRQDKMNDYFFSQFCDVVNCIADQTATKLKLHDIQFHNSVNSHPTNVPSYENLSEEMTSYSDESIANHLLEYSKEFRKVQWVDRRRIADILAPPHREPNRRKRPFHKAVPGNTNNTSLNHNHKSTTPVKKETNICQKAIKNLFSRRK